MTILGALCAVGMIAGGAKAVPNIQLYIEGATYDTTTETWVTTDGSFKLWVIGAVGDVGSILDMRLAVAYDGTETGSISITGGDSTLTPPENDAVPANPTLMFHGGTTDQPTLSDGTLLPKHGIYDTGVVEFDQYSLGDFTSTASLVGDFITSYPASFPTTGQINVYDVTVTGYSAVHFDAFNHVEGGNHAIFAPFSHDAGGGGDGDIPAPGAVILGAMGLGLVGWVRRRMA